MVIRERKKQRKQNTQRKQNAQRKQNTQRKGEDMEEKLKKCKNAAFMCESKMRGQQTKRNNVGKRR